MLTAFAPMASADATAMPAMRIFNESAARSFKRRATTACSWCTFPVARSSCANDGIGQFRKIKCNVEESNPCSNCCIEKIECTITKRRKTKYAEPAAMGHTIVSTSEGTHTNCHGVQERQDCRKRYVTGSGLAIDFDPVSNGHSACADLSTKKSSPGGVSPQ
jgi:hypothetical protein